MKLCTRLVRAPSGENLTVLTALWCLLSSERKTTLVLPSWFSMRQVCAVLSRFQTEQRASPATPAMCDG